MLAVSDESGQRQWSTPYKPEGLSTVDCLEFILSLPSDHTKLFAYSFGYDLTMMLRDVDDAKIYKLFRPDERPGEKGPKPVYWRGYALNFLNGRFTVKRRLGRGPDGKTRFGPAQTVHDIWRFYQGKFVKALEDWKAGHCGTGNACNHASGCQCACSLCDKARADLARIRRMKDLRSDFDRESPDAMKAYCLEECRYMATLARLLTEAHVKAGLELKHYFGAGSSASAMLAAMGVKEHIRESRERNPEPEDMRHAIASAFFGGRFENAVIGKVAGPVYSYDISSAYPYQLCFLPCLVHGKWERTRSRKRAIEDARTALVRYSLDEPPDEPKFRSWAPFPFRLANGSIVFPRTSGGGWVWRDEYLAGEALFPNVGFVEAWAYLSECDCKPFADVPRYYRERVRIGKEGPGMVLKLGLNSCYGKHAQSIGGQGPFTSWIWAGLITAGCRAQVLDALGRLKKRSSLLMVATDGICTTERIAFPSPKDTGTYDVRNEKGVAKPLGGWEEDLLPNGLFLARPGIYFGLGDRSDAEIHKVRARGIGRAAMVTQWRAFVDAYEAGKDSVLIETADGKTLGRFVGAKTGIILREKGRIARRPDYGDWVPWPVKVSFNPLPKREGVGRHGRLALRAFPGQESAPYKAATLSPEARQLKKATEIALEQADGGDAVEFDNFDV